MSELHEKLARAWLLKGEVIAYPTEAVWGLGCDPWNPFAVRNLLAIKNRQMRKGLILVAADTDQLGPLFKSLTAKQRAALNDSWPGPTTWLLPDPDNFIPSWVKGDHDKVAIRVSAHPGVSALCRRFGDMIISTSANRAGKPENRSRLKLVKSLGDKLGFVVPGSLGGDENPSTIRDVESGAVLR